MLEITSKSSSFEVKFEWSKTKTYKDRRAHKDRRAKYKKKTRAVFLEENKKDQKSTSTSHLK